MNRILLPLGVDPARTRPSGEREVTLSGPTMGVEWRVRALLPRGLAPQELAEGVQALLNQLVLQMSPWEADSTISRFNAADAAESVPVPAEFLHVATRALHWAEVSDGAFDPTLGQLVDLWGFGPSGPIERPPDDADIRTARKRAGWSRLALDPVAGALIQPGGATLDLSGIAKGYAVDAVSRLLSLQDAPDHLVEIGGECRGSGVKINREPWWVALETPEGLGAPPILAGLHGLSVATSGDYVRFLTGSDGRRLSHTIDGRTGAPVETDLAVVSVIHKEAMDADALATILTVLGSDAGLAFAENHGVAARLVLSDGRERLSSAFAAMLD